MSLLIDVSAALSSSLPFGEAWKRLRCIRRNHIDNQSRPVEKVRFEKHPQNDPELVYTANLMRCSHCTLHYLDQGFEFRRLL